MYHPHIISKPSTFMNFTFKILHWYEVSSHWKKPKNIQKHHFVNCKSLNNHRPKLENLISYQCWASKYFTLLYLGVYNKVNIYHAHLVKFFGYAFNYPTQLINISNLHYLYFTRLINIIDISFYLKRANCQICCLFSLYFYLLHQLFWTKLLPYVLEILSSFTTICMY